MLVANCLTKNEERWIWYSLTSVLDYVDQILVWDTGSTDDTVSIIQSIASPKIIFKQFDTVNEQSFTKLRQLQLQQSGQGWVLLLDADEIWPTKTISDTLTAISSAKFDFLIHRSYNLVGDVFHYQEDRAGKYHIGPYSGHLNIRAVNTNIPGLHFDLPYGHEGFFVTGDVPLQNSAASFTLIAEPYLHATHLYRSHQTAMQRPAKYKYELGMPLPHNYHYPPCFYQVPSWAAIASPWTPRTIPYTLTSLLRWPFLAVKRSFLP